jgi:hypothetical protein
VGSDPFGHAAPEITGWRPVLQGSGLRYNRPQLVDCVTALGAIREVSLEFHTLTLG